MSTTTFNLRNPITDRVEDVQVPNQCPKCQGVVCLSAPNEAGNIELRCYPCRWGEDFVPFPPDMGARPGPLLTPCERRAVSQVLTENGLYDLAQKFT